MALSSSITFWASASACVASAFAWSYAALLVWVLPVVGSASLVNFASSALAVFKVSLSALSFNNSAALVNLSLTAAILSRTSFASALVASSPLPCTALAACLTVSNSALIFSTASL